MSDQTNNNALNAINPLAYVGVNPRTPPNFLQRSFPPTPYDSKNVQIGAFWLDNGTHTPPTINDLYVLVSLAGGIATWLPFTSGVLETLTGNSGGPVSPTGNNINVVGDGTTINVVGNPGTSTLTISAIGTGILETLTGDSGGPVSPLAGNINILGTTNNITVTGNPGTHTLTINTGDHVATSYITSPATGTAIPAAGVLTFASGSGVTISAAGSTVTVASSSTPTAAVQFSARKSADTANATGDTTVFTIVCDTVIQNVGGGYNGVTGIFTAPVTGLYYLETIVDIANVGAAHTVGLVDFANHSYDYNPFNMATSTSQASSFICTQELLMNMGDTAQPTVAISGGAKTVTVQGFLPGAGNRGCFFNGFLIGSAGSLNPTFDGDTGVATPNGSGVLNVIAGNSTINSGASVKVVGSGNTLTLDVTDASANTFIGTNAGNLTLISGLNTSVGDSTLHALTSGINNVAIGGDAGSLLTSGSSNSCIGMGAGQNATTGSGNFFGGTFAGSQLITGSDNVLIADQAGVNYTGAESNNVIVGRNKGVLGESNVIRIGSDGVTTTNQTKCFINGINGVTVSNPLMVTMNSSTTQMGTAAIPSVSSVTTPYTPVLAFGGSSTGITYTMQSGYYNQIGNVLFWGVFIILSSKGAQVGDATITLPPVTALAVGSGPTDFGLSIGAMTLDAGYTYAWGNIQTASPTHMIFIEGGSGVAAQTMTDANFANNSNFQVYGFYFTA